MTLFPNPIMSEPLDVAIRAAKEAGAFLRAHFENTESLVVNEATQHDIKLELDVRSQTLITEILLVEFPDHALYGEEGLAGNQESPWQWIVDPIDGTVNYFYGIPHFCVSIALRHEGVTQVGVIFDPMTDTLWTSKRGEGAYMNDRKISVSAREKLNEAMIVVGFSKTAAAMQEGQSMFTELASQVRKVRIMGSAALGLAYIASGRLDAYLEGFISLWDIAAGVLLIEEAGGIVELKNLDNSPDKFSVRASNGKLTLP
ncbi:MAG: myo-inositol-1(or 4)-monophosphatase [Verrucomicrobiales bacterium]|jgi:myo-inositol-1(or 4)-monophosphatase